MKDIYLVYFYNKDYSKYKIAKADDCYVVNSMTYAWTGRTDELWGFGVSVKQLNTLINDSYRKIEGVASDNLEAAIKLLKQFMKEKIKKQLNVYKHHVETYTKYLDTIINCELSKE